MTKTVESEGCAQAPSILSPTFNYTGHDGVISSFAFMLLAEREGHAICMGTGIRVSPGIGLAARHVIEGYQEQFGDAPSGPGSFTLSAAYAAKDTNGQLKVFKCRCGRYT